MGVSRLRMLTKSLPRYPFLSSRYTQALNKFIDTSLTTPMLGVIEQFCLAPQAMKFLNKKKMKRNFEFSVTYRNLQHILFSVVVGCGGGRQSYQNKFCYLITQSTVTLLLCILGLKQCCIPKTSLLVS